MENQNKDQLVYEIDLDAPTKFSMVNGANINPEKANAFISLDYIVNKFNLSKIVYIMI